MPAPLVINNMDFARKALEVHGRIPVSQFSRVGDLLAEPADELEYWLLGSVDAENRPTLRLRVQGELGMECQRCLGTFSFGLDVDSVFVIVPDESAIPALPENEESLAEEDYVVADAQMRVLDLIEDEILLALPYAPKHDAEQCKVEANVSALKEPSPFAALKALKVQGSAGSSKAGPKNS